MPSISKRSLRASKKGVYFAERAILKFPTKVDFAAELEISRSTVQNFFAGKPVGRENFHKICQKLELDWQEVANLPPHPAKTESEEKSLKNLVVATSSLTLPDLSELRDRVFQRIQSMCGCMRILDMSQPRSTEDIYVDLNVYETIKGQRRLDFDSINAAYKSNRADPYNLKFNLNELRQRQISGLEAVNRYSKLIIFGTPGSGKTMFLKHLTLQCCHGVFEPELIPIFIALRDFIEFNSSLNLLDYISSLLAKDSQLLSIDLVKRLLSEGKFFIVIDGLDEIKPAAYQFMCQYLRRFTEWFPNNRYLFSCRLGLQSCNFEQFTEVEIADFQPEQILDFATKWFKIQNTNKIQNFIQKLEKKDSIRELATNPLLLTLLCILFCNGSADFPASRSEIYEEALNIMLEHWDLERNIQREADDLSLHQKKELLYTLALKIFKHKQHFFKETELKFHITNYLINVSDLDCSKIDSKKILKSIEAKHGLLVEQAKKVYSFSYSAFQEYLVARNFVFEYEPQVSTAMLLYLGNHIANERWSEIFLLVAEMLPQADKLFQIMSHQTNSLIAQSPELIVFLDWVNYKAQVVTSQFQLSTIRAFYFCLGFSQISGRIGSNFDLVLSLNSDFSRMIHAEIDLVLDLSLFNISSLADNLDSIPCPTSTFQRTLDRAIVHAKNIQPKLAKQLQKVKQQLPVKDNQVQFWQWWHQHGKAWSNQINSLTIKYRNIGYEWQFDDSQQRLLKQYYQANLLLLDCLDRSGYVTDEVKRAIKHQLLWQTEIKKNESETTELILRQSTF